eukprot:1187600-Rhodomonas_salina.1
MSGTDLAYGAVVPVGSALKVTPWSGMLLLYAATHILGYDPTRSGTEIGRAAIGLRVCYAMCGTELGYGPMRWAVPSYCMVLCDGPH